MLLLASGMQSRAAALPFGDDMVITIVRLVNYNGQDVSCVGSCDGIAIANVSGGIPPYTYLWEDGQSNQVAIGLCAGTHTVTVTDATGTCINSASITFVDPPALVATTNAFTYPGGFNISCFGNSDGQIIASASGGVGGYSYIWSDGQLGPVALGVPAGNYFVQVTDLNGCTDLDSLVMQEPDPLSAALSGVLPVSCAGRSDGSINVVMSGGSGSYSYAWSDGPSAPVRSGLSPGSYTVSVSDIAGCDFDTTFSIGIQIPIQPSIVSIQPESCEGALDGAVDIDVNGGTSPYTYRWTNGGNTQDQSGLGANDYLLTIRDNRSCTASLPVTIPTESTLTISALKVNPACNSLDGAIHLQVNGHSGDLSYLWSDGQTTASAIGLSAGVYDVLIMDEVCMVNRQYLLDNTSALEISLNSTRSACNANTGTASAEPLGGVPPYSWLWSDGQTTQTAAALSAGQRYVVELSDAEGCIAHAQLEMREDKDLGLSVVTSGPSTCGANNATATVSVSAGTPPFNYTWSTGVGTASVTGLRSGLYSVRVRDLNECEDTFRVFIQDPSLVLNVSADPSFCASASAGASAELSGGTAPYSYRWSSGDLTASISGKAAGTYWVIARDANLCQSISRVELEGSRGVLAEADVFGVSCESLQDGAIELTVLAGVPAISYLWSDGPEIADRSGLEPGIYSVQIRDAANCLAAGPMNLGDACDLPLDAVDDFVESIEGLSQNIAVKENDIFPDRPDIFIILTEEPAQGIALSATPDLFSYTAPLNFTGADSFQYALCNGFGLCDSAWVYIAVLPQFEIPNAFSPNGDGVNDFFDIRGITEFPDNELVVFNRWGSEVFRTRSYTGDWPGLAGNGQELPSGTYFYQLDLGPGQESFAGFVVIHR